MTNHLRNCILRGLHVPYFVILGFRDMDSVAIPLTDRAEILIRRAVRVNPSARNPHNPSWATMPGFRHSRTFPARYAPRADPGASGKGSDSGRMRRPDSRLNPGFDATEAPRSILGAMAGSAVRSLPGPWRATWTPVARLRHGTERKPSGMSEDAPHERHHVRTGRGSGEVRVYPEAVPVAIGAARCRSGERGRSAGRESPLTYTRSDTLRLCEA